MGFDFGFPFLRGLHRAQRSRVQADDVAGALDQRNRNTQRDRENIVASKGIAATSELSRIGASVAHRSDEPREARNIEKEWIIHLTGEETDTSRSISRNCLSWRRRAQRWIQHRCGKGLPVWQFDPGRLRPGDL